MSEKQKNCIVLRRHVYVTYKRPFSYRIAGYEYSPGIVARWVKKVNVKPLSVDS